MSRHERSALVTEVRSLSAVSSTFAR